MSHGPSSCSILGIFLGFLTSVVWLLLAVLGILPQFVALLSLGSVIGTVLNIIVAILGFLGFLLFGLCIFKKVWRCCLGGKGGC